MSSEILDVKYKMADVPSEVSIFTFIPATEQ